jgi:hypothetical protein
MGSPAFDTPRQITACAMGDWLAQPAAGIPSMTAAIKYKTNFFNLICPLSP